MADKNEDNPGSVAQAAREIAASSKISTTPPGPNKEARRKASLKAAGTAADTPAPHPSNGSSTLASKAHVDAINQVFALFRLNYHNQYYAAFPDATQLNQIKKLWLESLTDYPVEHILKGAKHAIENSEFLPSLHRMLQCAQHSLEELGLPPAREAYLEACSAAAPRASQTWSHPAVYLAGRDSDWYFLNHRAERETWPVFREHYQRYCTAVARGEELHIPGTAALEVKAPEPLPRDEQLKALAELRDKVGL